MTEEKTRRYRAISVYKDPRLGDLILSREWSNARQKLFVICEGMGKKGQPGDAQMEYIEKIENIYKRMKRQLRKGIINGQEVEYTTSYILPDDKVES